MKEIKEYPIWTISARWNNEEYKNNGISFTLSFRKNLTEKSVKNFAERWWKKYVSRKYPNETPELLSLDVLFRGKEVWFGTWFAHKSLNRFNSEKDAIKSFKEYIYRCKLTGNDWDVRYKTKNGYEYCPMGAEDYWRWKYCDCKKCAKAGHTIITH